MFLRIVHKRIRRDIIAISAFLFGLFIVRICRYFLFVHSLTIDRYMWYLYYIPYIAMPMLTLDAAALVGKGERKKTPVGIKVLWAVAILLMLGVLSNDIHHFLLRFRDMDDYSGTVDYNWLYYLVVIWVFTVTMGEFILLMTKRYLTSHDSVDREEMLSLWKMNIAMLKNEQVEQWQQPYFISLHHAEGLGVRIELTGKLPEEEELVPVIDSAITVHVTNVIRHAEGDAAYISSEKTDMGYVLRFTNNSRAPKVPVKETGGLANLRRRTEGIGGTIEISGAPRFELVLRLPEHIEEDMIWHTEY
ncbi:MAG: hypothetical protein IJ746_00630 [Ruminococcus sp.]|nr:hypothetical protein [Ruminococcus sp.]